MAQNKTAEGKGRGRPRAYDPQTALQQALGVFWSTGYSGASLDSIATAAGMNRPSLYAAFGDKHALYIKALEQYWEFAAAAMHEALTDNTLTLEQALMRFYEGQLSIYFSGEGQPRGCFAIGTATTEAVEDAEIRDVLSDRLSRLDTELETRLRAAIDSGELKSDADPAALAVLASSLLHSISIRARAGKSREELTELARNAVSVICG
ncbi:DNA-binding transcriptional repressor AcrR [Pseudomonas sp. FW306-02-F02-AA]|uniref:TetR family transcriptional regulator n=1 Tax=Pseudomonas fluorescens TaxID=294 RepID=A0A0N7H122_PSEFL|nr:MULTISPECIES: TetR/AcrR family transcriptional regulator [Pseudomonas]ALI04732.1 TetR family transcriptional regulator [Pseudomonas fluorescens]PMZ05452.1 DNA-binding transcriptional repressor AcrR [Pseudomonas sp. FW306-02-F02-AB]PMZ11022.1 DNA-binding transcriptional repressor AcrR [Pseudomonas sp. FW306-02-H06C]PMZ16977.1 DNA-binding transcriptional repressor AcrR [Pseudomonas sp. FW306-02-F02-AA]PMZ23222.1 DNA-binding transcriptional repressor AcrR [Pseudomonas sp. FW306-02-F08-AA]